MKTITTKSGKVFNLLPAEYQSVINVTPLGMIYKLTMVCQIANCGYIICHNKKNEFFDIYEPTDNEFDEEEVYEALGK